VKQGSSRAVQEGLDILALSRFRLFPRSERPPLISLHQAHPEPDRLCPRQFKGAGPRPTPDGGMGVWSTT
jgi:hypothetical protein